MTVQGLRAVPLFDGLTEAQLGELAEGATEVPVVPGLDLFREGQHADEWWVLLGGAVDLVRRVGREDVVVARMDVPGRWAGGFRAWDAEGVYLATGRGARDGRALRVPADVLRRCLESWSPLAARLMEGLYRGARSVESTARQRSSQLTIGTLAAGIAHEINNPASAATRGVVELGGTVDELLAVLPRLADDLPPGRFAQLEELRAAVEPTVAGTSALAAADREEALADWLDDHDVTRAWDLAPQLVAAGVDVAWCERAAVVLGPALEPGLAYAASAASLRALLAEVGEATRRISTLVGALRSYSQVDRASVQQVDVVEGLESTVAMLGSRLTGGVSVLRDYAPDVPRIEAYAAELNTVWTNLIDNALDAMDGTGTLQLTARPDGAAVVVEVVDDGPGMSPEVAARAFEAFFTTKGVGAGPGLGLDVARRIVEERHGGSIAIDSAAGRTVLRVRLPLRLPGR